MRRRFVTSVLVLASAFLISLCRAADAGAQGAGAQEQVHDLRIDPMLLVSVKEFRNIIKDLATHRSA